MVTVRIHQTKIVEQDGTVAVQLDPIVRGSIQNAILQAIDVKNSEGEPTSRSQQVLPSVQRHPF